jgi:5'-3' exonuclease
MSIPSDRPVLIIDGMNAFVRSYVAYPSMSSHGYQMGGCIGFLKTLRRLVFENQPSAVYVAWESGGSARRRKLFSEYKLGRRPAKLNRFYEDDIPDSEENKKHQLIALLGMLKHVPVCQLHEADCEGDDVVAYLSRGPMRGRDKVIASSDKDLYQLLEPTTRIYSLHKKAYVTEETVMEEYRIRAKHFALAKALCGDPGDNVPGVKGLGFKTAAKLFPFLGLEEDVILQEVIDYASSHVDESKVYQRVVDGRDDLFRNWRLVHLDGSMLSATQQASIDARIKNFAPRADRMGLIKRLVEEGIGDFDVFDFYDAFTCITRQQNGDT